MSSELQCHNPHLISSAYRKMAHLADCAVSPWSGRTCTKRDRTVAHTVFRSRVPPRDRIGVTNLRVTNINYLPSYDLQKGHERRMLQAHGKTTTHAQKLDRPRAAGIGPCGPPETANPHRDAHVRPNHAIPLGSRVSRDIHVTSADTPTHTLTGWSLSLSL